MYPSVPPVFELESSPSGVCSFSDADELYDIITTECFKRIGHAIIFDLVTIAQDFMTCEFCLLKVISIAILESLWVYTCRYNR